MPANILKADVLVTVHLAFVAFVVLGQLLILVGWGCGWKWVRNFWFRSIHLLSIGVVAAEGLGGIECPLTRWERELRQPSAEAADFPKDSLIYRAESSWVGRVSNAILFYEVQPDEVVWFQRGHIAFGVLVLLTFVVAPPRFPCLGERQRTPGALADPGAVGEKWGEDSAGSLVRRPPQAVPDGVQRDGQTFRERGKV
jgi:hypothetical protein